MCNWAQRLRVPSVTRENPHLRDSLLGEGRLQAIDGLLDLIQDLVDGALGQRIDGLERYLDVRLRIELCGGEVSMRQTRPSVGGEGR